ncbi:MAG: hypothetical protein AAF203_10400, partial [Pseudomonadota bacterium]
QLYQSSKIKEQNRDLEAILGSMVTSALASRAEHGSFPKTFEGLGWLPPQSTKLAAIVKYCSLGDTFFVGAIHKKTAHSVTVDSMGTISRGLHLPEGKDCEIWGI